MALAAEGYVVTDEPMYTITEAGEATLAAMHHELLEPLGDRVVLRPIKESDRTASGLYKPDAAIEKPIRGDVLAVGPGHRNERYAEHVPLDLHVGDVVVYGKYSGSEVVVNGETLIVIREADVIAKVLYARR